MKVALLAGFLIGLPAIAVVIVFWGSVFMIPAIASLFVAILPFIVLGLYLRGRKTADDEGPEH